MKQQITEPVTVQLTHPIDYGSEHIDSMTLVPVQAKHLKGLTLGSTLDDYLTLLGKVSSHPPSVIDELSFIDVQRLLARIFHHISYIEYLLAI